MGGPVKVYIVCLKPVPELEEELRSSAEEKVLNSKPELIKNI